MTNPIPYETFRQNPEKYLEENHFTDMKHPDSPGIFITIRHAAVLSSVHASTFLKALYRGTIHSPDPLPSPEPRYKKNQDQLNLLYDTIRIPLSALKPFAIMNYWKEKGNCSLMDLDLGAELYARGWKGLSQFCENIQILQKIEKRALYFYSTDPELLLDELTQDAGLSRTTYYEELAKMYQLGCFKKHQAMKTGQIRTSICPASEDFLIYCLVHFNHKSYEDIRLDLAAESGRREALFCRRCAHNPQSTNYKLAKEDLKKKAPTFCLKECFSPVGGMKVPKDQSTVYRFDKSLSPSLVYFFQHVKENWEKNYLYKIDRQARYYGEVFFCDFVQLDLELAVYYPKRKEPIHTMKPWACIISDGFTGAIVSSSVSFTEPTTQDVIRCLAIATVYKIDSPFHGIPKYFYFDGGSQFKASSFRDKPVTSSESAYMRQKFFEDAFLPLMGIQWIQQTDSHPWLKPEERINETIQYKECINIPGWSGGARRRKFKDIIEKELLRLKANQALWTIDKFAFFWHDHLVPAYNNYASQGQKSPLEKYVEDADLITPSWSTISVFAEHKEIPELRTDGIIHNGRKYASPEILEYVKDPDVKLYIYDFGSPVTHCIPVFVSDKNKGINKFLGLAYEKEILHMVDEDQLKLEQELAIQYIQKRDIKDKAEGITYLNELMDFNNQLYIDYTREERQIIHTRYQDRVDHSKSDQLGIHLDTEALKAKIAEHKAISDALQAYLQERDNAHERTTC